MRISDDGELDPIPFDNDPELVKWARYGVAQLKAQNQAQREREGRGWVADSDSGLPERAGES